jgi:membrane protease YdiL (CAAX protease family)
MHAFHLEAPPQTMVEMAKQNRSNPGAVVIFAVVAICLAPVAEEILFRGLLYPMFRQFGLGKTAWVATSALFAAVHGRMAIFLSLFFLALLLVWLYEKTNNLLAPIIAHSTFNAISLLWILLEK